MSPHDTWFCICEFSYLLKSISNLINTCSTLSDTKWAIKDIHGENPKHIKQISWQSPREASLYLLFPSLCPLTYTCISLCTSSEVFDTLQVCGLGPFSSLLASSTGQGWGWYFGTSVVEAKRTEMLSVCPLSTYSVFLQGCDVVWHVHSYTGWWNFTCGYPCEVTTGSNFKDHFRSPLPWSFSVWATYLLFPGEGH